MAKPETGSRCQNSSECSQEERKENMKNEVRINVFDLHHKSFCMSSVNKI